MQNTGVLPEEAFTCSSLFMVNCRNAQPYYEHIQVSVQCGLFTSIYGYFALTAVVGRRKSTIFVCRKKTIEENQFNNQGNLTINSYWPLGEETAFSDFNEIGIQFFFWLFGQVESSANNQKI